MGATKRHPRHSQGKVSLQHLQFVKNISYSFPSDIKHLERKHSLVVGEIQFYTFKSVNKSYCSCTYENSNVIAAINKTLILTRNHYTKMSLDLVKNFPSSVKKLRFWIKCR